QLMLAWLLPWLRALRVPQNALRLACPINRRAEHVDVRASDNSDLMRGYMTRHRIEEATTALLGRLWDALTADTPDAMLGISPSGCAVALRSDGRLRPEESEVCLTEVGAQGVEVSIDILTCLPLCEWIGGTLLVSPDRVWRWTEKGLVPDHADETIFEEY